MDYEERENYRYQTLSEFLKSPFGIGSDPQKDSKYNKRYNDMKKKIYVEGYTSLVDDYFIHVKVPSESDESIVYDVVLRFFSPTAGSLSSLNNYYIQFFSNSPGFMYKYAVLYKVNGFLIEDLYKKMDPNFIDKLPDKANPSKNLTYDSTIYFACKFLSENNFSYLSKFGILLKHKKQPIKFFEDIFSFSDMKKKIDMNKDIRKKQQDGIKDQKKSTNRKTNPKYKNIKMPKKSTSLNVSGIHTVVKKSGRTHIMPKKQSKNKT